MLDGENLEEAEGLGLNFRFMDLVDFDSDGLADIIAPSKSGTIFYRRLDESGDRWEQHVIFEIGPKAVAAGDVDGDGRMEVLSSMPYHIFDYSTESGKTAVLPLASGIGKSDLVKLLDLDGDGDLDVLCSSEASDIIFWLENPLVADR